MTSPLRLWPGVAAVIVIFVLRAIVVPFVPGGGQIGLLVATAAAAMVILWWVSFSRAAWLLRLGALTLIALAAIVTRRYAHPSIGGSGGGILFMFLLPVTIPTFLVAAAIFSRRSSLRVRWLTIVVAILLANGVWLLARVEGIKGEGATQLAWRWTATAEERLLTAHRVEAPPSITARPAAVAASAPVPTEKPKLMVPAVEPVLWSGFRGAKRDAAIDGARLATDWKARRPTEIWRRRVGPAWSSFAVAGDLVFTQEQRGEQELISAYTLSSGEPAWQHQDAARFWEPAGGAGPRATPTVHGGRVYAMGATGIVNALDATTGARIWRRNADSDAGVGVPDWGFAGSPVVVGGFLVTAASGRLIAYDLATGTPRWTRRTTGGGYSSPHPVTLGGVPQILLLNGSGITSVGLDGEILWSNHAESGMGIVQPQVLDDRSVLVCSGAMMQGNGLRRLSVSRGADGTWSVEERWSSRGLKPYFSDYVVHKGHAYGFDGTIMSAVNLESGERVWKGGRYGAGQVLLVPGQDLLLVISEEGDLVLVGATPDKHTELAKFKAIEGKTWNHPVLVGDVLLVRNGEEMAAFRLR